MAEDKVVAALKSFSVFQEMVTEGAEASAAAAGDPSAVAQAEKAAADIARTVRFVSLVECAYLIASADGSVSADETAQIKEKLSAVSGGTVKPEVIASFLGTAERKVKEEGRDARIRGLADRLSGEEREVAFIAGAAAAWKGGGVGVQEGLAMQAIAKAFGWEIGYMHKLLGKARG